MGTGQKLPNIRCLVDKPMTMCGSYLTNTYLKISGANSYRCIGIARCLRYNQRSFTRFLGNVFGYLLRAWPPLASNGPGPRPPAGAFPGTASQPPVHPPPTAGPRPPDLGRFRASSSFLPPFPPQQAKVRKKHVHLWIPRRPVWKRNTRQPAGQVWCVAGACLGVTIERATVGSSWKPGPRWGPLASPLAPRVAML